MVLLQRVLLAGMIIAVLMKAAPVLAPYHVLVIEQIFFGTLDAPDAQYVMLRTLTGFQVFVANQGVNVQNGDGSAAADFGTFAALTNPRTDSGVAILMGTPEAEALFGVTMDHITAGRLISPDGRICFGMFPPGGGMPVDCVAYGAYSGTEPDAASPAPTPVLGMALVRVSNTTNDANDFRVAAPCPQNNAGSRAATCPTPTPTLPAPSVTASETPPGTPTPTLSPFVTQPATVTPMPLDPDGLANSHTDANDHLDPDGLANGYTDDDHVANRCGVAVTNEHAAFVCRRLRPQRQDRGE